jgi:hypothetical protein
MKKIFLLNAAAALLLVMAGITAGCSGGFQDPGGGGTLTISGCPTVNSILVFNTAAVPATQAGYII